MTATRFGRYMTEITESIPDGRFKIVLDRAIRASECPLIMPQRWLDLKETHPNPNPNPNPHLALVSALADSSSTTTAL